MHEGNHRPTPSLTNLGTILIAISRTIISNWGVIEKEHCSRISTAVKNWQRQMNQTKLFAQLCYEHRIGVGKDKNKAFTYCQKSSVVNNSNGMSQIGYCYYF